jgi:hypothetical protein
MATMARQAGFSILIMKTQFIFAAFLLVVTASALNAADGNSLPSADEVVASMQQRDAQRRALLEGYRGMRQYILDNTRMHKHAEMHVRVQSDVDGTKHFAIVDEEGWKAASNHVFRKMLESEAETSHPQISPRTRMASDNYEFHMVGIEPIEGRSAYAIDIVPKRHEERLFQGRIWIDTEDYALVRAEGKPAKSPSFWVRSVHFVHTYQKTGSFWFPVVTESVSEVRILGATKVTINYFDYAPKSQQATERASMQSQPALDK